MKTVSLVLLAFFIGSLGGWFTGEPEPAESTASEGPKVSKRHADARAARAKAGIPADVAARLTGINAATTPAERLRATIHLARTLPVSEFGRWYDQNWLKFAGDADTAMFDEITRNRWMEEDPEGLFNRAHSHQWTNLSDLAERWARRDPERALAYVEGFTNPKHRDDVKRQLLGGLATSSPALFLDVAGTMAADSDELKQAMKRLAESHPGALAAADLPPKLRRLADYSMAHVGFEKDFPAELARLAKTPGGAAIFMEITRNGGEFSKSFTEGIFNHLHEMPVAWLKGLNNVVSWSLVHDNPSRWLTLDFDALGMDPKTAKTIQDRAWDRLVSTDPEATLRRLANSGMDARSWADYSIQALQSLHRKDPAAAETWRGQLLANAPTEQYAKIIGADLARKSTEVWKPSLDYLRTQLSSGIIVGGSFEYALPEANPEVSRAIIAEIAAMDVSRQAEIGHALLRRNQSTLPHATQAFLFDATIRHPTESDGQAPSGISPVTIAGKLAATWVAEEPVAAGRWAVSLPAGEVRQWTLRNLVATWLPLDAPNAEAWLRQLPPANQSDVREFLKRPLQR